MLSDEGKGALRTSQGRRLLEFQHFLSTQTNTYVLPSAMYLSPHKFTKNIYMNTPQRLSKLKSTAKKIRLQKKAISLLTERIRVWSEEHSVEVQAELSKEVADIAVEKSDEITAAFPEGSFNGCSGSNRKQCPLARNPQVEDGILFSNDGRCLSRCNLLLLTAL